MIMGADRPQDPQSSSWRANGIVPVCWAPSLRSRKNRSVNLSLKAEGVKKEKQTHTHMHTHIDIQIYLYKYNACIYNMYPIYCTY